MLLSTSKTFTSADFTLSTGAVLPELTVAYETFGTLAADKSNAILMCHGYTNHPHATGGGSDTWAVNLIGPGKGIDTDKYFVVCSNMLGSAYGTTGPASTNPATGKPYGPDFPKYTTADMVAAQHRLLDHFGIGRLRAVVGYSYGGHLTYLWGVTHPDRMDALVPIAGVMERKTSAAQVAEIRDQFADCPGWNGGHYYGHEMEPGGVFEKLVAARKIRLTNYGIGKYLEDQGMDQAARDVELTRRAEIWAHEFDANSLYKLYEAGVGSDTTPLAGRIKAPLLQVLANTDSVVPVALGPEIDARLKAAGVTTEYVEIDTAYGHAGPMIDAAKWDAKLRAFLAEHAPVA